MPVTIRQPAPDDAEVIAKLLVRSIREVCGPDYDNDEDLLAFWCANKTAENIRRGLANPNLYWTLALQDDAIAGVGAMSVSGEILLCYVLPEYLGRGWGQAILNDLIRNAQVLGLKQLVLESTRTARDFYLHHGFVEVAEVVCMGKIPGYRMILNLGAATNA